MWARRQNQSHLEIGRDQDLDQPAGIVQSDLEELHLQEEEGVLNLLLMVCHSAKIRASYL